MLELMASIEGQNNTTISRSSSEETTQSPVWFIVVCFLISCLCILGNGCVIYLVKTRASLQRISNAFIVSLAFADLLVGLLVFPSKLACELLPSDVLLQRTFSELFVYWSVYNLCGMTIERFLFLVFPMKHHIYMSKKRSTILIVLCWLIPLVNFGLHFTWLYSKSEEVRKFWLKNFTAIETITMVGLPSIVLVVLYSKIFTVAQRHRKVTANQMEMVSYNRPSSPGPSEPRKECTNGNVLISKEHIKSRLGNYSNEKGACTSIEVDDENTPGNYANTGKCDVNEGFPERISKLTEAVKTTNKKCAVDLNNKRHESKNNSVVNQKREATMDKKTDNCQNYIRRGSIDKVDQTWDIIRQDGTEKTVDGFINRQSKRIHHLNAAFKSNYIANRPTSDDDNAIALDHTGSNNKGESQMPPNCPPQLKINDATAQNKLSGINRTAEQRERTSRTRKQPIIEYSSDMSSDAAVSYLAFYSAMQSTPKVNKQSIKKRLNHVIQKRGSGASVVGAVIATFLICWGVSVYGSICYYFELCFVSPSMNQVQWMLLLLNSAVNPIVYAMHKTDLRREFRNLLRWR